MNPDFKRYRELLEEHLLDFLPEIDPKSNILHDSMTYSLNSPGKRLRPSLLLGACEFAGGDIRSAIPYACSIEYIHTYSLIHDDLPAMDNDDLRRGMPTNHKVFGDGVAILAGDALLTTAFETMGKDLLIYFDNPVELKKRIKALYEIAKGSGCRGMITGQIADIEAESKQCSKEMLDYIHVNKTAALIVASIRAGFHLGSGDEQMLRDLTEYAENLGLAFQIADDVLDIIGNEQEMGKKAGVDSERHKSTYPGLYGLDVSIARLNELTEKAIDVLKPYYDNAEFFVELAKELATRGK